MPEQPRSDIVVVGASAGGVEALTGLFAGLPQELEAAVFVVLHIPATHRSMLPEILRLAGKLPVSEVRGGEPIEQGRAYVAAPDHHLRLGASAMTIDRGPKENRMRPSIDVLFRSAALSYGPRVVGVLLSGTLDDGVAGLIEIKESGGVTMVQDPSEAKFPDMPENALRFDQPDYSLPVAQIALLLCRLSSFNGSRRTAGLR